MKFLSRLLFNKKKARLTKMTNFTEKPESVFSIFFIVFQIGLSISIIYIIRQFILILLLFLSSKKKQNIELNEAPDFSLKEEKGKLDTNHLHFSTIDHLFDFKAANRTRKATQLKEDRKLKYKSKLKKIKFKTKTQKKSSFSSLINNFGVLREDLAEFSIISKSESLNENSLLSDTDKSIPHKVISKLKK